MRLSLSTGAVHATGKIKGFTREALRYQIAHFGGRLSDERKLHDTSSMLLVGTNPKEHLITAAMGYNVPIVSGEELELLLKHGEVSIDEGSEPFDTLVEPIERLLTSRLTHEAWLELCHLVDTCREEELPKLLAHIQALLDTRTITPIPFDLDSGELRPFPNKWLGQAIHGVQHPKFALCQTASFQTFQIGDEPAAKLFEASASMKHLGRIDVGEGLETRAWGRNFGEWFFRGLGNATWLDNIHTLTLRSLRDIDEALRAKSLSGLRALYMRPESTEADYYYDPAVRYGDVLGYSSWSPQLETIGVSAPYHLPMLSQNREKLSSLEHLAIHLDGPLANATLKACIEHLDTLLPHIKRISLFMRADTDNKYRTRIKKLLDAIGPTPLDVLDLRGCFATREDHERLEPSLLKHMKEANVGQQIATLCMDPSM